METKGYVSKRPIAVFGLDEVGQYTSMYYSAGLGGSLFTCPASGQAYKMFVHVSLYPGKEVIDYSARCAIYDINKKFVGKTRIEKCEFSKIPPDKHGYRRGWFDFKFVPHRPSLVKNAQYWLLFSIDFASQQEITGRGSDWPENNWCAQEGLLFGDPLPETWVPNWCFETWAMACDMYCMMFLPKESGFGTGHTKGNI